MSDISFDQEIRDNFLQDLKSVGDMVKRAVSKLENKDNK